MERLLEIAAAAADQAEVFALEHRANEVCFRDAVLHSTETELLSGVSLRIIKDGRLGTAYTRNLLDREGLVDGALASLAGGVEAAFDLPATPAPPALDAYDPAAEEVSSEALADEGARIVHELTSRTGGVIQVDVWTSVRRQRILNSRGADLAARTSDCTARFSLSVPGTGAGFSRIHRARALEPFPDRLIDEAADLYRGCVRKVVRPPTGRMKVLFMPNSMFTLTWRVLSGASGRSVFEGTSPVADRVGERILSDRVTILDDPRDTGLPHPRPFDDEGVECDRFPIVTDGVLNGIFVDLDHAAKLGVEPTGHGYRRGLMGGDPLTLPPTPAAANVTFATGESSLGDLIAMIDRGLVLEHVLGAHSGNIPNGDYSVGVAPALHVEDGEIVGRVKDAMVSGNVYDTLRNVVAVGDRCEFGFVSSPPPVLCDDVRVATR